MPSSLLLPPYARINRHRISSKRILALDVVVPVTALRIRAALRGARGDSRRSLAAEVIQHRATSRSLGMKRTTRGLFLNTEQSAGHYAWGFVFAARAHISSITCICKRSQLDRRGQRWKCCGFLDEQTFSHQQSTFRSIEILLNITSTYLACKLIYRSWNEGTAEHLLWPATCHRPWDVQTHPCLSRAI